MALIIVGILLLGYLLIATESVTNVNKAAVAIFVCTVGWVLYISYGTDFVMSQHASEYAVFLHGAPATSISAKEFIAQHVFLIYVGKACEIVLFLLATRTIVDILDRNECFDFITQLLATRSSSRMLWLLGLVTLLVSANLDNLVTTVMMLMVMRKLVHNRRQRMVFGSAIVIAANCGGAMTVIGSPTGLMLWNAGLVSASHFFLTLVVPCLLAWAIPTWWIGRSLPEHVESEMMTLSYRGDDSRLAVWQRMLMLCWGLGGLWFIPTFHNITKLSPFLGALCVLSVLWVVNEIFNRKFAETGGMSERRVPTVFQDGSHQLVLFVLGMMMAWGVVKETGALDTLWDFVRQQGITDPMLAMSAGAVSAVLDNFATAGSFIMIHPTAGQNDGYWSMIAFMSAVGGNILSVGSISGRALMGTEKMRVGWYFSQVGWKAMVGMLVGFAVLWLTTI